MSPAREHLARLALVPHALLYIVTSSALALVLPQLSRPDGGTLVGGFSELLSYWFFDGWTREPVGLTLFTLGSLGVAALGLRLSRTRGLVASLVVGFLGTWAVYAFTFGSIAEFTGGPLIGVSWWTLVLIGVYSAIRDHLLGLVFAALAPALLAPRMDEDALGPLLPDG